MLLAAITVFGQSKDHDHDKDTVSHSANHAGNWVSSHVNAPHKYTRRHRRVRHHYKKNTVTHAVNHAGNWVSHHVNAPHH